MKLALLHLSDIHFKSKDNLVSNRYESIVNAIIPELKEVDKLFLIFSGDIAFSGLTEEYNNAKEFVEKLEANVQKHSIKSSSVFVPGNHDCDFKLETDERKRIKLDSSKSDALPIDTNMIKTCCVVQKEYFEFCKKLKASDSSYIYTDELVAIEQFIVDEKKVTFILYNTSWLSTLKEEPGKLFFPTQILKKDIFEIESEVLVGVLHHPFNWFIPEVKRDLQNHIENTADIVLSGHEHISSKYVRHDLVENFTEYIEGDVLQGDNHESGFNLIIIDTQVQKQKLFSFKWKKDIYENCDLKTEWREFLRNKKIRREKFQINDSFKEILLDAGASFTHPFVNHITLKDIFIYPYLLRLKVEDKNDGVVSKQYISGASLKRLHSSKNYILIAGAEKTGKTSLCKMLYLNYHEKGFLPIFIDGTEIRNANYQDFEKLVQDNYCCQYGSDSLQYFIQEDNSKKIVIIDDYDKSKPNKKYKTLLLKNIIDNYPHTILTGNDFFILEELFNDDGELPSIFSEFHQFKLLEFGNELRSELVKKWYGCETNEFVEEAEFVLKHDNAITIINKIVGSNLVPSLPIFLLTILQTIETKATNLKASSYGFYYEFLITKSFKNVSIPTEEIDAFYNYITELANHCFERKTYRISIDNFQEFHSWYCKEYSITSEFSDVVKKLELAKILELYGGNYRFKYKYIFYYFEARYIANNLTIKDIRDRVALLASRLHKEEYANILMFLTHLSKDPFIISEVLQNAKKIFESFEPAKFEDDIKTINNLLNEIPKLVLEKGDYKVRREEQLKNLDQLEKEIPDEEKNKEPFDDNSDIEEIDVVTQLNIAFKSIELLGQILKNYFGSLKGTQKLEIGSEAYFVGLRSINSFFEILSSNIEMIVEDITKLIFEKEIEDKIEKEDLSRKFLFGFCSLLAFSFIKRISESIGTSNLSETFREIQSKYSYNSVRLIDISIKLDHFHKIPIDDIKELKDIFSKNYLSSIILGRLVIDHLYMFPVDYRDKQKICDILGIPIDDQILIGETSLQKKSE
jgi:hypothetical protein